MGAGGNDDNEGDDGEIETTGEVEVNDDEYNALG
jgi:hypothetical protein